MKLIETKTLTSTQTSVVFSNIPQNFTDLFALYSFRGANNAPEGTLFLTLNGSNSGFSRRDLNGNGSSAGSSAAADSFVGQIPAVQATSNIFGNQSIYITNYTANTGKSYSVDTVEENNATVSNMRIIAGFWNNTAAITSLGFTDGQGIVAGSTVSLYGIGGAGDGYAPKATGGAITFANGYWVHTFTASGTFTPTASLSNVEYLVIAGGAGGASAGGDSNSNAGGGGAGGYRSSVVGELSGANSTAETRLSLSAGTNYTVTVGAGGAAVKADNSTGGFVGLNGNNSVFSTITSIGGGGGGYQRLGYPPLSGGSGGGGSYNSSGAGTVVAGASGTANQGFAGGAGASSVRHGGGGGGAGAVGLNGDVSNGAGGSGISSSITGSAVFRAGGGGQSNTYTGSTGAGGNGGGGAGVYNQTAASGTANTGGGGGANAFTNLNNNYFSGAGGSGIVIVRYLA